MADKTILSDCLDKINSVLEAQKPLIFLSKLHKKTLSFLKGLVVAGAGLEPTTFGL